MTAFSQVTPEELLRQIQREFPEVQRAGTQEEVKGYLTVKVDPDDFIKLLIFLKEKLGFNYLDMITGVDWKGPVDMNGYIADPNPNPFLPEGATPQTPSAPTPGVKYREVIQVVYIVSSLEKRVKVAIQVDLPREHAAVPSLVSLFPAADWQEREAFDLLGIQFVGHPRLTKILTPDFIIGHPLRKDYIHHKDRFD